MNFRIPAILLLAASPPLTAQSGPTSETYLDAILEKPDRPPSQTEIDALDRNNDRDLDVRDLVIFLNGEPVSASFASAETLAFYSATSVTLPIHFSKPVTGTIKLDLGGNASEGADKDFTILYHNPALKTFSVSNATSLSVTLQFPQWRGVGGEKIIRLTINRNPAVIVANGTFSTHLLRIRQFEAGEFVGMLSFPPGSGLPSLPIRMGLGSNGSAVCSFQQQGSLLGPHLSLSWNAGNQSFPNFPGTVPVVIPGASLGRLAGNVNASLSIQRMDAPYEKELEAYLEGFPSNDQPALYHATFTFHNLIAAGARFASGANPYAVVHQGRLTLQPVRYAAAP